MRVTVRQAIARPPEEVFEYLADASNNPSWQSGMVACTWEGDGPIALGSRYRQQAKMMGRPIVSLFEVTAFEAGRSISIATIESSFPIQVTRGVEPTADGCIAEAIVSGEPSGCFALLGPLMKPMLRGSVTRDYKRLGILMESRR